MSLKMRKSLIAAGCAGMACAWTAPASGGQELQFDLNTITTRIAGNLHGGTFDEGFSGNLRLGHNPGSTLAAMLIDGANMGVDGDLSDGAGWALSHFSAKINLANGNVVGGNVYLEVERVEGGARSGDINYYEAVIASGEGAVRRQAGQGFRIDGLTIEGMFSDSTFAGIDISPWFDAQPLAGSFINFSFDPGTDPFGEDQNSNIDIFVIVPTPLGGVMGLAGMTILTMNRRRRFDV